MSKVEQQSEHFKSVSEKYLKSRKKDTHLLLKDLMWRHFLSKKDFLKRNRLSVLEPMCGYAEGKSILEESLNISVDYEGYDISDYLVVAAKELHPESKIYVADVTTFSPDGKYDLVIIIGGLHHVPDHSDHVVKRINKLLKRGGYFIALEPTQNNFLFKKIRQRTYRKNEFFDEETEQAFDLGDLNDLFERNGFKIIDQIYPGLLSYILYYNPDVFPKLGLGGKSLVKATFALDKLFMSNIIGKKLAFATLTLLQKI